MCRKSIITPVAQYTPADQQGQLTFREGQEIFNYPYLDNNETTKILGLNISYRSWTHGHMKAITKKTDTIVSILYGVTGMDIKAKLHLMKAIIIPL